MIDLLSKLLSFPSLNSIPSAVVVIIVVCIFVRSQRDYSRSHREERIETAKLTQSMAEDSRKAVEEFTALISDIQEQRIHEQAKLFELYREQTICMEKIVAKCQR